MGILKAIHQFGGQQTNKAAKSVYLCGDTLYVSRERVVLYTMLMYQLYDTLNYNPTKYGMFMAYLGETLH